MENLERRAAAVELRADGRHLVGIAAPFNVWTPVADFRERIVKGAFADTLAEDVVALVDHDRSKLLARTRSGTLRLAEDDSGLRFEIDLPLTQLGSDTLALVERGDIGGASFAFTVPRGGDSWQGRDRTLTKVRLHDVSIVSAYPAYPQTSVSARSRPEPRLALALAGRYLGSFGR